MEKTTRILLGVLSFLPLVYMIVCIPILFIYPDIGIFGPNVDLFMLYALIGNIMIWPIVVCFMYNVFKNESIPKNDKPLYVLGLLFFNVFFIPFYWYSHIWNVQPISTPKEESWIKPLKVNLSSRQKVLLGIMAFLPLIFMITMFFILMLSVESNVLWSENAIYPIAYVIMFFYVLFSVWFFCRHAWKNERVPHDKRLLFVYAIFFLNIWAYPFYWYYYIYHE
jgi:hypothetical protein